MQLYSIETGLFKLDGGAMFGVVPKSIWQSLNPADENNMCSWALRCLLVQDGNRLILIDNGIGDKQDKKFFGHYFLHGDDTLEKSLNKLGFTFNDVTDMVLSHLHFDHCGGSIKYNSDRSKLELAFPNATYWSTAEHWQAATQPNKREKASFLKENILPIEESGQLKLIKDGDELYPGFKVFFSNGHTDAMMHPVIDYKGKKVVFVADMIPSSHHIPLPYVMAYDIRPMDTMTEKEKFLNLAAKEDYILFFEHDPLVECCNLQQNERGVKKKDTFTLKEYFG